MRILGIDYGLKRTGIAVTDSEQILASSLSVLAANEVIPFIESYILKEQVEGIVVGMPKNLDNSDTDGTQLAKGFVKKLKLHFPQLYIETIDERFTSSMAKKYMIQSGLKKTDRRDKSRIDQLSAEIILSDFLKIKENLK